MAQSIVGARYGTKLGDDGHIRAYAKFRQFDPLPYVVSTTPSDDKLRGTQAGFDAYMVKPVDAVLLAELIARVR